VEFEAVAVLDVLERIVGRKDRNVEFGLVGERFELLVDAFESFIVGLGVGR